MWSNEPRRPHPFGASEGASRGVFFDVAFTTQESLSNISDATPSSLFICAQRIDVATLPTAYGFVIYQPVENID